VSIKLKPENKPTQIDAHGMMALVLSTVNNETVIIRRKARLQPNIGFTLRVHAFGYNSAESEPI